MSIYAIIHTETCVVRRMTSEDPPSIMSDETAVLVPDAFNADGIDGPFKLSLDGLSAEPASEEEIKAALSMPRAPAAEALYQKAMAVTNDPTVPQTVRELAAAVVAMYT